jgi:glycine cleavage system H lipoate-binding protein
VGTLFHQKAGVGVSEVVKSQAMEVVGQDCPHRGLEVEAVEGGVVERASVRRGEDVSVPVEQPLSEVQPELVAQRQVQEYGPRSPITKRR